MMKNSLINPCRFLLLFFHHGAYVYETSILKFVEVSAVIIFFFVSEARKDNQPALETKFYRIEFVVNIRIPTAGRMRKPVYPSGIRVNHGASHTSRPAAPGGKNIVPRKVRFLLHGLSQSCAKQSVTFCQYERSVLSVVNFISRIILKKRNPVLRKS